MYDNYATIERAGLMKKKFRARIFGGNGEPMFISQTHNDKRDALNACHVIRVNDIRDHT